MNSITYATEIEIPEDTLDAIRQEIEDIVSPTPTQPTGLLLTVEAKDLLDALKYVKGSIATRATLPVLQNVLLSTVNGKLQISGTNLEVGMTKRIPASVTAEGAITLPFRLLLDSVGKKGQVTIQSHPTGKNITTGLIGRYNSATLTSELNGKKVVTDIMGISAEEFPIIPELDTPPLAMLDLAQLQTAIRQVAFCASDDDSRPVLAGVLLELYPNGSFVMAAADGFRLAKYDTGNLVGEPTKLIIPAKAILEIQKMSGELCEVYTFTTMNRVIFKNEVDEEVTTQLVEGNYVDLQRVIPTDWATRATLDTAELIDSVKMCQVFAKDGANIIRFHFADVLTVSANAAELGNREVEQSIVSLEGTGETSQIALNGNFVIDALKAVGTEQVVIDLKTYQSPAVIRPADNDNLLYVIMPMYLPNR